MKRLRHDTMIERVLNTFDLCLKYHSFLAVRCAVGQSDCLVIFFLVLLPCQPFPICKFHIFRKQKKCSSINLHISQCFFFKKKTRQLCICTSHCTTQVKLPEWLIERLHWMRQNRKLHQLKPGEPRWVGEEAR